MTIFEVANFLNAKLIERNNNTVIGRIEEISSVKFNRDCLGWCSDKNMFLLDDLKSGTIIISEATFENLIHSKGDDYFFNCIVTANPRLAFAEVLKHFYVKPINFGIIHPSVVIDSTVNYKKEYVNLAPNVVIEEGVILGNNIVIGANTVIKSNTIIEDDVKIGSNCTIGGVGFGYEQDEDGIYQLIPHIGNVHIKSRVEIGNNTCIDRAVIGSTVLESEVKVDNLVHIAHGVNIGSNSLVIAHAMIAGSVKIGENTWVAPCASIRQKLNIGSNVTIGMGSVVVKNIPSGDIVAGVPAKKINN